MGLRALRSGLIALGARLLEREAAGAGASESDEDEDEAESDEDEEPFFFRRAELEERCACSPPPLHPPSEISNP